MYYRRKIVLAVLQRLNRPVARTDFQKIIFLVSQAQQTSNYHFIPYKFGCYSYQLDADKRTLTKYELIRDDEKWSLSGQDDYFKQLKLHDQNVVEHVLSCVRGLNSKEIIRYVYVNFPYFAINSEIVTNICSDREANAIEASRPKGSRCRVFTLGYEGRSFEEYLNLLVDEQIDVLCDVRKSPISRKYGFSKNLLSSAVKNLGVEYKHIPELGIASDLRRLARSKDTFNDLFGSYEKTTLMQETESLRAIETLIKQGQRVALTCFEASNDDCHRSRIIKKLSGKSSWKYRVKHL